MSDDERSEKEIEPELAPGPQEKFQAHRERILRTVVACFMGIVAGVLSFAFAGPVDPVSSVQPNDLLGWLILLAFIVFQKYVFIAIRIDFTTLTAKDWFYQAFMTFSLWFISWTLLLSAAFQ